MFWGGGVYVSKISKKKERQLLSILFDNLGGGEGHFQNYELHENAKKITFFSRLRCNGHIPFMQCERKTAYLKSMLCAHAQTFFIAPSLPLCSC